MWRRLVHGAVRSLCDTAPSCSGRTWAESCQQGAKCYASLINSAASGSTVPLQQLASQQASTLVLHARSALHHAPLPGARHPLQLLQLWRSARSYATVTERKQAANPGVLQGACALSSPAPWRHKPCPAAAAAAQPECC